MHSRYEPAASTPSSRKFWIYEFSVDRRKPVARRCEETTTAAVAAQLSHTATHPSVIYTYSITLKVVVKGMFMLLRTVILIDDQCLKVQPGGGRHQR
jgi:hypothetical protein